ncbi:hypothetical protein HDZ31DRAFT_77738, partial [Schizophyllum fasciatum]
MKRRMSADNDAAASTGCRDRDEPERPSTPVTQVTTNLAVLSLHKTPRSMGSGSLTASGGFKDATVRKVYPWIAEDVKKHHTCDIDTFLKFVLAKVDRDHTIDPDERLESTLTRMLDICNMPVILNLLKKYCSKVDNERDRYGPFVELFNQALEELFNIAVADCHYRDPDFLDIHFCRNAEREITGIHYGGAGDQDITSKRKPDVITTSYDALARVLGGDFPARLFEEACRQPPSNFTWHDVLSAWEFKLERKELALPAKLEYNDTALHIQYGHMDISSSSATPVIKEDSGRGQPQPKRQKKGKVNQRAPDPERLKTLRSNRMKHANPARGNPRIISREPTSPTPADFRERPTPAIQAALYGAEMLSRAPAVSHAIGVIIYDSVVHVWWYDHEGAIQTTGLNFIADLPRFLALLFAFQRFNPTDWGLVPGFDLGGIQTPNTRGGRKDIRPLTVVGRLGKSVRVDTTGAIHKTLGLKGRATYVVLSGCVDAPNGMSLVSKLSWADNTRDKEGEIITRACDLAGRNKDFEVHMPLFIDEKQWDDHNTRDVRQGLGIPLRRRRLATDSETEVDVYRVLRMITTERLMPIQYLKGMEFIDTWFQCAEVHFLNWRNGIHHQDPSLNNLMCRERGHQKFGVLNDWDLAIDVSKPQTHTGFEVTGTVPFMAIDLLSEEALSGQVKHLYRHDLEAMFYILVW